MIGANVNVRRGWGAELAKEINQDVRGFVEEASKVGADVASQAADARRRTGKMARIHPVAVRGTPDGWEGGFRSEAFYSGFQSRGTGGSRTRKVKASTLRRRQTASGQARQAHYGANKGVTPLHHEEKGLAAAKAHLLALIDRLT